MRPRFLGTGGAFEPHLGNSAVLVEDFCGKTLLIDCGFTTYARLVELGLDGVIDEILVTHLHADHVGSLTNLIFVLSIIHGKPARVLCPDGPLRDALDTFLRLQLIAPERYVEVCPPPSGITPIDTSNEHVPGMPSSGYILRHSGEILVHSGDTAQPETIFKAIAGLHPTWVFHEVSFEESPAHTHWTALQKWQEEYALFGYHCDPERRPAGCSIRLVAETAELNFGNVAASPTP